MAFSGKLLQGKVGLVTGAGSPHGIGRSLVLGLASAGARAVYAADLSLANIPSLQKAVRDAGHSCEVQGVLFDVSSENQTVDTLKRIIHEHGRLDFYFANAGFGIFKPLQETDGDYYDRAVAVMQRSVLFAIKYGGQAMSVTSPEKKKAGGSIVITSSIAAISAAVSDISYSTVKAAANAFVKSGSVQLSTSNVRVNAIAPGFVRTSIMSTSQWAAEGKGYGEELDKEKATYVFDEILGPQDAQPQYYYNRIPEPEEIANIGVFLSSDLSASINGQVIVADSGKTVAALGETVIGPVPPLQPLQ